MEAIINFFKGIGEALLGIFDFIIGLVNDLIYIIKLTGEFVAKIPSYFSWLPAPVLALIISAFAVVVIYKVLGREG